VTTTRSVTSNDDDCTRYVVSGPLGAVECTSLPGSRVPFSICYHNARPLSDGDEPHACDLLDTCYPEAGSGADKLLAAWFESARNDEVIWAELERRYASDLTAKEPRPDQIELADAVCLSHDHAPQPCERCAVNERRAVYAANCIVNAAIDAEKAMQAVALAVKELENYDEDFAESADPEDILADVQTVKRLLRNIDRTAHRYIRKD